MNYFLIFILVLIASFFSSLLSKFIFRYLEFRAQVTFIKNVDGVPPSFVYFVDDLLGDLGEKK